MDGHDEAVAFRVRHALRVKGFAPVDTLADITGLPVEAVERELQGLSARGRAHHVEARDLWRLTPAGREAHASTLPGLTDDAVAALRRGYDGFLPLNARFKELCGTWQLRDGEPNDHRDPVYDAGVLYELERFHAAAVAAIGSLAAADRRFDRYGTRLQAALDRLRAGQVDQFTGVMRNSYHDIWMELHEDLILVLGVERVAEGSY